MKRLRYYYGDILMKGAMGDKLTRLEWIIWRLDQLWLHSPMKRKWRREFKRVSDEEFEKLAAELFGTSDNQKGTETVTQDA